MQRRQIGDRMQVIRKQAGFATRASFARVLGIKPKLYCSYESGRSMLPPALALQMCRRYGMKLTWLYTGEGSSTVLLAVRMVA